jgi:RNA polymerase II subunit A small phosphatase-like protein
MSKILSLDLDETLISSVYAAIPERYPDFDLRPYVVYKRPYVNEFLDWAYDNFDQIGVFTTATKNYAEVVVENVFGDRPLAFMFTRKDCVDPEPNMGIYATFARDYYKDATKILQATKSTLKDLYIVDDKINVYHPVVVQNATVVVARRFAIHTYRNTDEDGLLIVREQLEKLLSERE